MKVALLIDQLIKKDDALFMAELILNIYEDSEVYTLAHQIGLGGRIEGHRIHSSFLSKTCKKYPDFIEQAHLWASALKSLTPAKEFDLVISLSTHIVHAHQFKTKRRVDYVLEQNLPELKGLKRFFLGAYLRSAVESGYTDKCFYSSEALAQKYNSKNTLLPAFNSADFFFAREGEHPLHFEGGLVYIDTIPRKQLIELLEFLNEKQEKCFFIGDESLWKSLGYSENENFQHRETACRTTTARWSHDGRWVINLKPKAYPVELLGALCAGTPVIASDTAINKDLLGEKSGVFIGNENLIESIKNLESKNFDRAAMRRKALKINGRLFKKSLEQLV